MLIKKIHILTNDLSQIVGALRGVKESPISCANWKDQYAYMPEILFKLAHNENYLYLQFRVKENEIMALVNEDQGRVHTDSSVELYISFGGDYYYNLGASCIGKIRFGYHQDENQVQYAEDHIMSTIKRYSTLGDEPFNRKYGCFKWILLLVIPRTAFWKSGIDNFMGIQASGNFSKRGDELSQPHYLSWKPVRYERPNFHLPEFFGNMHFEE